MFTLGIISIQPANKGLIYLQSGNCYEMPHREKLTLASGIKDLQRLHASHADSAVYSTTETAKRGSRSQAALGGSLACCSILVTSQVDVSPSELARHAVVPRQSRRYHSEGRNYFAAPSNLDRVQPCPKRHPLYLRLPDLILLPEPALRQTSRQSQRMAAMASLALQR